LLGALSLLVHTRVDDAVTAASGQSPSGTAALVSVGNFLDQQPVDALRRMLGLTSSGTVRVVDRLEAEGLISRGRGADARAAALSLTASGRRRAESIASARATVLGEALDALTASERAAFEQVAAKLIETLVRAAPIEGVGGTCRICDPEACGRSAGQCPLVETTRAVRSATATTIDRVDPASADAVWCVEQYFAELGERFAGGFDPGETAPAEADELVPPRGVFLVARLDGEAVGCGAVKTWSDGVADIKRMWVSPRMRGTGLGKRLLKALEGEATVLGLGWARLETNGTLSEAIAMYRGHGYAPIEPYSGDPYAELGFERELVGLEA
jgi:DNA-binding MarR family transcriptional regulator/GNAT superfamily N-acetyltransferase